MNKQLYRVYWRDPEDSPKWTFAAAFVSSKDAGWYVRDKTSSIPSEEDNLQWKIMFGNKNIQVIK